MFLYITKTSVHLHYTSLSTLDYSFADSTQDSLLSVDTQLVLLKFLRGVLTDLTIILHHNNHHEIFQMYLGLSIKS